MFPQLLRAHVPGTASALHFHPVAPPNVRHPLAVLHIPADLVTELKLMSHQYATVHQDPAEVEPVQVIAKQIQGTAPTLSGLVPAEPQPPGEGLCSKLDQSIPAAVNLNASAAIDAAGCPRHTLIH